MAEQKVRFREAVRVTRLGMVINLLLVVLKLVAGLLGRSTAIIADAFHSGTDFFTDIAVIAGFKLASRPADRTHKYGHGKYETMTAFLLGIVLTLTALGIGAVGVKRVIDSLTGIPLDPPELLAVWAAILSIALKEFIYHITKRKAVELESDALLANALHHRSDSLSSLAVLAGIAGAMLLGESWRFLDPAAAILVCLFILKISVVIIKKNGDELLDRSLDDDLEQEIISLVSGVAHVLNPHNLRTRRIGNNVVVDIHVEVVGDFTVLKTHDLSSTIEELLKRRFGEGTLVFTHFDPRRPSA